MKTVFLVLPITTKKIRNTKYIYFTYHDEVEGKQKHVCCGAESNPEAKKKAIKLEIELLENQESFINTERKRLEKELKKGV